MQHKQHKSKKPLFIIGLALMVIGGIIALMVADIPAPQTPIEKQITIAN